MGRGPLFSRLGGLGERELSQRGPGLCPGRKRILAYFEGHRTLLFVLIMTKSGGQYALSSPTPNSRGDVSPRDLHPWY